MNKLQARDYLEQRLVVALHQHFFLKTLKTVRLSLDSKQKMHRKHV